MAGLYTAPMQDAQHKLIVNFATFSDTVNVRAIYDTSSSLLIFGGWVDDNPIYRVVRSGVVRGVGPRATRGGVVEPWVDTIPFGRIYIGMPPTQVVNKTDFLIKEPAWGDTTKLVSHYSPNIVFTIRRPDVLEFAKDSNHSIFRVLRDDNQELFIVAKYNNRLDSIKVITTSNTYCMPWPHCYYNPMKISVELPRVYLDAMVDSLVTGNSAPYRKPPDD